MIGLSLWLLKLPIETVHNLDGDEPFDGGYDKENSAEKCPVHEPAVIPKIEVGVGYGAAMADCYEKPG